MFKKILIIGKGSSSLNHYKALKKIKIKAEITHVSSRDFAKIFGKNYFKLLKLNPDYFIICSPSIYHFKFIDLIEKNFTNKKILVEKPLFSKKEKGFKSLKNEYFIGYNLRHHPVLKYVKTYIKNKKIYFINNNCSTYLPNWRKKNYSKTVSAQRKLGGGVKLELSHELDYLIWNSVWIAIILVSMRPKFIDNYFLENYHVDIFYTLSVISIISLIILYYINLIKIKVLEKKINTVIRAEALKEIYNKIKK